MRCAFYSGSFDPPTLGHRDIIRRGLKLFDKLVVGIGINHAKTPMFPDAERMAMLRDELNELGASERGEVVLFQGLAVDAARNHGASVILRGVRDASDLAYEMQMAGMNAAMAPDVETVFLSASPGTGHITATLVRQIVMLGGDASPFVADHVARRIKSKYNL